MAKDYINPVATGLAIGQGEAQVFDTSGIWAAKLETMKEAKAEKEKKEKELLDSLVQMDVSQLYERDLDMYNTKWDEYQVFVKDNFKALQNPSKNVDIFHQKRTLEQSLLQFVGASGEMKKIMFEAEKEMSKDSTLRDRYGDFEALKSKEKAGVFSDPWEYIDKAPEELAKLLKDNMKTAIDAYDVNKKYENEQGVTTFRRGTTSEKWEETYGMLYDDDKGFRASADEAYENAGGESGTGFATPKEYAVAQSLKLRPELQKTTTRDLSKQGNKWSFGSGWGEFGDTKVTGAFINQGPDVAIQPGQRNLLFRKKGKNLGYQEMDLTNTAGEQEMLYVAVQDVVEKGKDNYVLRVRVPSMSQAEYKNKAKDIADKHGGEILAQNKQAYLDEIATLQKEMDKGAVTKEYPLTETVNIQQLNSTLDTDDFYSNIPKLLSTKIEGFDPNAGGKPSFEDWKKDNPNGTFTKWQNL